VLLLAPISFALLFERAEISLPISAESESAYNLKPITQYFQFLGSGSKGLIYIFKSLTYNRLEKRINRINPLPNFCSYTSFSKSLKPNLFPKFLLFNIHHNRIPIAFHALFIALRKITFSSGARIRVPWSVLLGDQETLLSTNPIPFSLQSCLSEF
jgi:hypothetical protein